MATRLAKEELLKKIDNEELKKQLSELTEEELKGVIGGAKYPDGSTSPYRIKCKECQSENVMLILFKAACMDCGFVWNPSESEFF